MAGLESIALAVEHLERAQQLESSRMQQQQYAFAPYRIPPRSYLDATPRAVSNDLSSLGDIAAFIFKLDLSELYTIPILDPTQEILYAAKNDVLCGRGGETNNHRGNITYRLFVKACQSHYIAAKRRQKPFIAQRIVLAIRQMGGRFLKKDRESDTWRDVGNVKAREKTSQALREGAPDLKIDPLLETADDLPADETESKRKKNDAPISSAHKKHRFSLVDLADAAAASPRSSPAWPLNGCVATVSEDSDSPRPICFQPQTNAIKGPMKKMLKKRLQEESLQKFSSFKNAN
jgi:hypothetical protein